MRLSPVTLAVMKPIVAAASAMVDMCPMATTEDIMILCSNTCVLPTFASTKVYDEKIVYEPKHRKSIFDECFDLVPEDGEGLM